MATSILAKGINADRDVVFVDQRGLAVSVFCGESVAYTTPAQALARARQVLPGFPARVLSLFPAAADSNGTG